LSLFTIDESKCNRCGACADECVTKIIEHNKGELPKQSNKEGSMCYGCGHCVAVCPTGSFKHRDMSPSQCIPIVANLLPSIEATNTLLKSRRSIRNFLDQPVPRDTLKEILETASYAPSGLNGQPVKWIVIDGRPEVKRFAKMTVDYLRYTITDDPAIAKRANSEVWVSNWDRGMDSITWGAPHMVIAYAEGSRWEEECKIALTFLDLAAYSHGLGACWAGLFNFAANAWAPMREALGVPAGHNAFGAMMLGYPKNTFQRIPVRLEPRVIWK